MKSILLKKLAGKGYDEYGWKNHDDWADAIYAEMTTDFACRLGGEDCRKRAQKEFSTFVNRCQHSRTGTGSCNHVHPNYRRQLYCWGIYSNSDKPDYFNIVKKLYEWSATYSRYFYRDTDNLMNALSCSKDDNLVSNLIADTVRGVYPAVMLRHVAENDESGDRLWNFFTNHTTLVLTGATDFRGYIKAAISGWNTMSSLRRVTTFVKDPKVHLHADEQSVIDKYVAVISSNVKWYSDNKSTLEKWLAQEKASSFT
ncbi:hypothetical protein AB6A40_007991 [Gnathostoma spinigerum]|uniref:ERAP1-like C-terminal domain-containing protein n=1 Tax=Gnathostoma spinigerum TaxID=75299 RepID=A0ABD6EQ34_9BILA